MRIEPSLQAHATRLPSRLYVQLIGLVFSPFCARHLMTYICDFFFHMFHILRVLQIKIIFYILIALDWYIISTNLSSAAVRNSSLILGCQTPEVNEAVWPLVLAMSVMYMSPLTYSAFSKPSLSRTLAWQFPEMISTRSPVMEYWTYLIGWLMIYQN